MVPLREWKKATAVIDLPPMGHTVLMLAHGPAPKVAPWQPSALVRHDRIGVLSLKTPAGTETLDAWTAASLAKGATFAVYPDPDDTWGHTVKSYSQHKLGAPELTSSETLTDGPVVRIIRQRARWKNSQIIMDIVNYREIAATEIRLRINWQEKLEVLKFEVPTVLQNPRVFAEITGGEIERKLNGHEEHCHNWVALEGTLAGKPATVAVLNDRTYSYDAETTTAGGVIRMTVLRSNYFVQHEPVSLPPNTDNPVLDQGWQERRFWLIADDKPHSELHLTRLARELTLPAEYAIDCAHPGTEPWDGEGLEVSPANIFLTGIKKPEQGEGRILRLQETSGKPTKALLRDPSTGLSKEVSLGAWEVRSYRVTGNKIQEVDMLERPL
jgi:alpha-mannosidase